MNPICPKCKTTMMLVDVQVRGPVMKGAVVDYIYKSDCGLKIRISGRIEEVVH